SVTEGDTATFTVTLSNPSASTVTVDYVTSNGTAEQPGDYTLSSGTATFLPGETSKPVTVPTIEDLIDEPQETFGLNLSNVANATIADPLGEGTILDDDDAPSISIDDVSVAEGDTATFTVTLSNPSASTVTVDYGTSDGTASQPGDYTLSSGTVTFLPGETSKPVTVPTIEDLIDEPDETFAVNLSNASNATIADLLGEGTIVDDDAAPTISVDDVTVDEGDTATFTVSLSSPSAFAVTVDYGTSDGTAAQPGDYSLSSGTVTFLPGETSKPVTVPTIDDLLVENDESFDLNLSNASNANIGDPLGVGSILDNDEAPRLTITKDGPGPVQLEDTILYTITVQNTGTVDLHNVTLDDPLLGLSESLGTLVVGEIVTFTPTFGPVTEEDLPGPITNTATANSDETDPVSDGHLVSIITEPVIDLSLTKVVDNPTPSVGENVVFTTTLTNANGFDTATGVRVKDLLPDGFDFVSSNPEIGIYSAATGIWNVGVLPPGVTVTLEITATVLATGDYESEAEVSKADQEDVDSTPANAATKPEDDDDAAPIEPSELDGGEGGGVECIGKVIISEVAWAGTAADPMHEWIELRNIGSAPVDLTGWTLQWRKKNPVTVEEFEWKVVSLSGTLAGAGISACEIALQDPEPTVDFEKRESDDVSWLVVSKPQDDYGSYYVLERLSDRTIANIEADELYDLVAPYAMELSDEGDEIQLLNAAGVPVDTANAFDAPQDGWPAGDAATHASMERTDPLEPDEAGNWHTNIGIATRGTDANGRPLVATGDALNSQSLEEWAVFATLDPSRTLSGRRIEVGLDLSISERRESGWPWIRVTRPIAANVIGGGASAEPDPSEYSFSSRTAADLYWLAIDTIDLAPGDHLIWIVYGEGEAVLVPITVLP
ncbi:MAG: Calx-beta domain-containing protein, partial [Candidatus Bipolaricaulia bacterium]